MISPDLFSLLNLGIVLRITERGGEKVWSVLDYEISVRIKMEARSSFFYIKACYTELLVLKEQTWFSKRILGTWTVVGNAAGFGNWLDFLLSLCPFKFWPVFCGFFPRSGCWSCCDVPDPSQVYRAHWWLPVVRLCGCLSCAVLEQSSCSYRLCVWLSMWDVGVLA